MFISFEFLFIVFFILQHTFAHFLTLQLFNVDMNI